MPPGQIVELTTCPTAREITPNCDKTAGLCSRNDLNWSRNGHK